MIKGDSRVRPDCRLYISLRLNYIFSDARVWAEVQE